MQMQEEEVEGEGEEEEKGEEEGGFQEVWTVFTQPSIFHTIDIAPCQGHLEGKRQYVKRNSAVKMKIGS